MRGIIAREINTFRQRLFEEINNILRRASTAMIKYQSEAA